MRILLLGAMCVLFMAHVTAVGRCEGIEGYVKQYDSQLWNRLVKENRARLSSIFNKTMVSNWVRRGAILGDSENMLILHQRAPDIAEKMGIYTLYNQESIRNLYIQKGFKTKLEFAERVGMSHSTVRNWLNNPNVNITYHGQVRLNYLARTPHEVPIEGEQPPVVAEAVPIVVEQPPVAAEAAPRVIQLEKPSSPDLDDLINDLFPGAALPPAKRPRLEEDLDAPGTSGL